jgi:hypothetical protein
MPITFDAEEITGKLDAIRLTQLPFAASRAANQLGWELKNNAWPAFARRAFTASGPPVPFTTGGGGVTGGLLYKHNRGDAKVEISLDRPAPKGQDPARYLAPTESGGPIYTTRFSRALGNQGFMPSNFKYAAPLKGSNGFTGQINGKVIKPGYYQSILAGLARGSTPTKTPSGNRSRAKFTGYRFFSLPQARGRLRPGIYRAQGRGELQQLFSDLDQTPSVPSLWSFEEFAERESLPILERILPQFIEEALK